MATKKNVIEAKKTTVAKKLPELKSGRGCWVARQMDVEVDWPSREGRPAEVIGIYNTETKEFKWHEAVGDILESHCEDNPDDDYDELYEIYMREAEDWARTHNSQEL